MNKGGSGRRRNQVFIQVPRRDSLNLLLGYLLGEVDSIFRSVSFPAKDRLVLEKYNIHVRNRIEALLKRGGELLKLFGGRSRVNLRAYRSNQIRNREIIRGRE